MTDAAMAARAECVMLNKGPNVPAAIDVLNRLYRRMGEHQVKKTPTLRALHSCSMQRSDSCAGKSLGRHRRAGSAGVRPWSKTATILSMDRALSQTATPPPPNAQNLDRPGAPTHCRFVRRSAPQIKASGRASALPSAQRIQRWQTLPAGWRNRLPTNLHEAHTGHQSRSARAQKQSRPDAVTTVPVSADMKSEYAEELEARTGKKSTSSRRSHPPGRNESIMRRIATPGSGR